MDKYGVLGLRDLAKKKLRRARSHFWSSPSFQLAARHAFSTTPERDKNLKGVVGENITNHIELMEEPSLKELLKQFTGLALDILEAKIRDHRSGKER